MEFEWCVVSCRSVILCSRMGSERIQYHYSSCGMYNNYYYYGYVHQVSLSSTAALVAMLKDRVSVSSTVVVALFVSNLFSPCCGPIKINYDM